MGGETGLGWVSGRDRSGGLGQGEGWGWVMRRLGCRVCVGSERLSWKGNRLEWGSRGN